MSKRRLRNPVQFCAAIFCALLPLLARAGEPGKYPPGAGGRTLAPRDRHGSHRTPRGATPDWLAVALNILKDSTGQLSDREIAKKVGVAHSTLVKNKTYMHAKFVYFQKIRQIVRVGQNIGKLRIHKE